MAEQLPKIGADGGQPRRRNPNAFVDSGAPDAGRAFRVGDASQVAPSPHGTFPLPADDDPHRNPGSVTARGNGMPVVADVFGLGVFGLGVFGLGSEVARTVAENPE